MTDKNILVFDFANPKDKLIDDTMAILKGVYGELKAEKAADILTKEDDDPEPDPDIDEIIDDPDIYEIDDEYEIDQSMVDSIQAAHDAAVDKAMRGAFERASGKT